MGSLILGRIASTTSQWTEIKKNLCIYANIFMSTYVSRSRYIYIHTCIYTNFCMYLDIYMHAYISRSRYMYVYIPVHTEFMLRPTILNPIPQDLF